MRGLQVRPWTLEEGLPRALGPAAHVPSNPWCLGQARGQEATRRADLLEAGGQRGAAESGRGWFAHMQTSQLRPHAARPFSLLCPLLHPPGHSGLTCPCYHDTQQASHPWFSPHPDPHPPSFHHPDPFSSLPPPSSVSPTTSAPLGQMVSSWLPRRWKETQLAGLSHYQALPLSPGPWRGLPSVSPRWMLQ